VFAEQRPDVAARMHAYQLICTGTGASARSLIKANTSVCSTMSTPAGSGVLMLFRQVVVWPLSVLVTVRVFPQGANAVVHGLLLGSAYRLKLALPVASVEDGPAGMMMSTTAGSAPDGGPLRKIGASGV